MKSENLQHEKKHRKPIRIPNGCEVLRGDLRSGKHLQIRDFQGSIMCWIQKSEALEKLETQMKKHYAVLQREDVDVKTKASIQRLCNYADYLKTSILRNKGIFMELSTGRFLPN